jgi:anaerobic magnesium-protoporphyrin IX monomethyl ester cyclase
MKVLLVEPASKALTLSPPIGLGYLASMVRKDRHEVNILDAQKEGISAQETCAKINAHNPDVIGISIITPAYYNARKIIRKIRRNYPRAKIVVGGPHASALPELTLKETGADFAIRGEGEHAFRSLVNSLSKNKKDASSLKDASYIKNGKCTIRQKISYIEDLDSIPFPAWDLMKPSSYPMKPHQFFIRKFPTAPIITSRGCPYACDFCSASFLSGRRVRFRSARNVVSEIELLVKKYGVREIHFEDDNFTISRKHVEGICKEIIKRKLQIVWQCPNGIRMDVLNSDLVALMRKSGCYRLAFGIESGSQKILDTVGKRLDLKKADKIIRMVKDHGVEVHGFFILGFPDETKKTAEETLRFINEHPFDFVNVSLLSYLPGSRLFREKYKKHDLKSINWERIYYFSAEPSRFLSAAALKKLQKKAMSDFYMNVGRMARHLRYVRIEQIPDLIKGFIKYIC